ncbi:MAG: hypothetical protein WCR30_03645 [Clostridia bacterium]
MKDGLVLGIVAGFILGMVTLKNVPEANRLYEKGEKMVTKAMKSID